MAASTSSAEGAQLDAAMAITRKTAANSLIATLQGYNCNSIKNVIWTYKNFVASHFGDISMLFRYCCRLLLVVWCWIQSTRAFYRYSFENNSIYVHRIHFVYYFVLFILVQLYKRIQAILWGVGQVGWAPGRTRQALWPKHIFLIVQFPPWVRLCSVGILGLAPYFMVLLSS